MKGKNKGKIFVQLPGTDELKFIKREDLQTYLNQGYLLSNTHNKRKEIRNMKPLN